MGFDSPLFWALFPAAAILYFVLPRERRWIVLLGASYFFYLTWKAGYVFVLIGATLTGYFGALLIASAKNAQKRRLYLWLSLSLNAALLLAFKFGPLLAPPFKWIMPIGLSFFTLQIMSYTLEVFYRRYPAEKNIGLLALYASFFPLLQAGPIERPARLLPQFKRAAGFDFERLKSGLQLVLWGFFKKIVLAEHLRPAVDKVFNNVPAFDGPYFALAAVLFAYQIYCDFSGYTDIARGAAQILGFDLMENFKRPYSARSVAEFWSRWHISLTTWLRDYIFLPLSYALLRLSPKERWLGVKLEIWTYGVATGVTMLICGLWHGVAPTFILWGGSIGFYLFWGQVTKKFRKRLAKKIGLTGIPWLYNALRTMTTFALICFSWIFFRANSFADARVIIGKLAVGWSAFWHGPLKILVLNQDLSFFAGLAESLGVRVSDLVIIFFSLVVLGIVQWRQRRGPMREFLESKPWWLRWGIYYLLIAWILFLGNFETQEFIYAQF